MKGVVNSIDSLGRITCMGVNGEFYHSHGKPYNELSENPIALCVGDGVEFETGNGKAQLYSHVLPDTKAEQMEKVVEAF